MVLIAEDPRTSHRANEALRIALGVAAGENEVTLVLCGPAAHLLDADTDDLVDGDDVARHREALKKLGVLFHVEAAAIPAGSADWNREGQAVIPVPRDRIGALVAGGRRALLF